MNGIIPSSDRMCTPGQDLIHHKKSSNVISLAGSMPASADKVLLVVSSPEVAGEVAAVGKVLLVMSTVEVVAEVTPSGNAEAAPAH